MGDIVERLVDTATRCSVYSPDRRTVLDAKDEIERLRAENADMRAWIEDANCDYPPSLKWKDAHPPLVSYPIGIDEDTVRWAQGLRPPLDGDGGGVIPDDVTTETVDAKVC
jgi:hypothetical protein